MKSIFTVLLIIFAGFTFINCAYSSTKDVNLQNKVKITGKKAISDSEKLALIDKYQSKYFEIVKRHDMFLQLEGGSAIKKDEKELKKLYKKIEKQITNNQYLEKYKNIEKRYAECDEITTVGMNEFAYNNYKEVNTLLNEVYKEVKSKISAEDFNKLVLSERKWLKEVEDYKKVYNSMDYGTIGTIVYYTYQIDMRNFRTLLLMLYL